MNCPPKTLPGLGSALSPFSHYSTHPIQFSIPNPRHSGKQSLEQGKEGRWASIVLSKPTTFISVQSCESFSKSTLFLLSCCCGCCCWTAQERQFTRNTSAQHWVRLFVVVVGHMLCYGSGVFCCLQHAKRLGFVVVGYYFSSSLSLGQICYQSHQALVDQLLVSWCGVVWCSAWCDALPPVSPAFTHSCSLVVRLCSCLMVRSKGLLSPTK